MKQTSNIIIAIALFGGIANAATISENFDAEGVIPPTLVGAGTTSQLAISGGTANFGGWDVFDRNYLRTVDTSFFSKDFTAEITLITGYSIAFFGMGDLTTLDENWQEPSAPTIGLRLHSSYIGYGQTDVADNSTTPANNSYHTMSYDYSGTHRIRLTWNSVAQQALFEVDNSYDEFTGFVADSSSGLIDGSDNGLTLANTSIYFGGNSDAQFDNLVIIYVPEPSSALIGGMVILGLLCRRRE